MRTVSIRQYALFCLLVLALPSHSSLAFQSGSIAGRIKERDGKSLAAVVITATRQDDASQKVESTSGEKGEFHLTGLKGGEYVLRFEKAGYRSFTSRPVKLDAGDTMRLRSVIELIPESPPYSMIRGAVFSADGFSIPNANVTVERIGEGKRLKRETTSIDGGEFTFKLPPEKAIYRVSASARGFESSTKEIEVGADEIRQVAISLTRSK